MTQWAVGMLAVRVKDLSGVMPVGTVARIEKVLSKGQGNVSGVWSVGLELVGWNAHPCRAWCSDSFRPAVQDNKKADEKFTALIKGRVKA